MSQEIVLKPYLTEKTFQGTSNGRYTFLVDLKATKGQIKDLIETLYKVNVVAVNTKKTKSYSAKSGRTGRYTTTQPQKQAIVQLKDKQTLPIFKTK